MDAAEIVRREGKGRVMDRVGRRGRVRPFASLGCAPYLDEKAQIGKGLCPTTDFRRLKDNIRSGGWCGPAW